MTATLTFDIPEERELHIRAIYGMDYRGLIADLDNDQQIAQYSNTPKEEYAGIEAVTTAAGGGPNVPKHPHDIRVKDPSQHPGQQEY